MQQTYNAVIADTSCFILLDKIGTFDILHQLFKEVITSLEVVKEFGKPLPYWIKVVQVKNENLLNQLIFRIDKGEASAIVLAKEFYPSLLIIDDLKGRKIAGELQLFYTGTLGVLLKARQAGVITSLRPYFDNIRKTNFRISHQLLDDILYQAGD